MFVNTVLTPLFTGLNLVKRMCRFYVYWPCNICWHKCAPSALRVTTQNDLNQIYRPGEFHLAEVRLPK